MKLKSKASRYTGFELSQGCVIDRIDPHTISPESFFASYVSQRKPCILTSHHLGPNNGTARWKSLDYLKQYAGTATVQTETKQQGQFGSSRARTTQPFAQFLDAIARGDQSAYLTTQYTTDPNPAQDYCHSPLTHLLKDFPTRPSLLPTLVPQQVNLWLGASRSGTSSALHHDFADNLYVLLSGTKRFTVFAPSSAESVYLNGQVKRVCENGMIIYKGSDVRSDGAYKGDVLAYQVRLAEAALEAIEGGEDYEATQYASNTVEEAMENLLDYEMKQQSNKNAIVEQDGPVSFSKITTLQLESGSDEYPLLKNAVRMVFEVKQGEMLYLPAGWMHEVTSYSNGEPFHLAMNYWFHPPVTAEYKQPYEDGFWEDQWTGVERTLGCEDCKEATVADAAVTCMRSNVSGEWEVRDQ